MKKLIKRMFNKMSKKEIDMKDIEMICNNPPNGLNSFCSAEYGYLNKKNY
jgi:hypothetical protein